MLQCLTRELSTQGHTETFGSNSIIVHTSKGSANITATSSTDSLESYLQSENK